MKVHLFVPLQCLDEILEPGPISTDDIFILVVPGSVVIVIFGPTTRFEEIEFSLDVLRPIAHTMSQWAAEDVTKDTAVLW